MFEEKVKKSNFFNIFFKIDADHLSSNVIFSNWGQKILKLSLPVLWKRFEIKSQQRKAHYLKSRRNGRQIPTGGGSRSPPPHTHTHWLGLKLQWKIKVTMNTDSYLKYFTNLPYFGT